MTAHDAEKAFLRSITAVRFRVACLRDDRLELVPGTHARWDTDEELAIPAPRDPPWVAPLTATTARD